MHDGSHLIVKGILNTVMEYKERYIPVCIKIVNSKKSFGLVGRDVLESYKVIQEELVTNAVEEESLLPLIKDIKVDIGIKDDVQPVVSKAREPPIALQGEVHAGLDRMECNGVISLVTNGTEWASPLVVIPKRDGRLWICCDLR